MGARHRGPRRAFVGLALGLLGASVPAAAQSPAPSPTEVSAEARAEATSEVSSASAAAPETKALISELARAVSELRLADAPAPYEATLRVVRARALTLDGSYGGIITDLAERQAFARLDLRVGGLERDASNFFGGGGIATVVLPLDPLAGHLSSARGLWRLADAAYRDRAATYRAKEAARRQLAEDDDTPDRSAAAPVGIDLPWSTPGVMADAPTPGPAAGDPAFDRAGLREAVRELSARFADHPEIDNGDVYLQIVEHRLTSIDHRGAVWGDTGLRAYLAVVADTRAEDGVHLDHGAVIHLQSIPTADFVRKEGAELVDRVLAELEAQRVAPRLDEDYDGPVLFSAEAAAALWASTVAVHATGAPAPLSEWGPVIELEPHWLERLGRPVLPPWLSLIDDPTREGFGHYRRDAEGMPAERIQLVKRGVLGDLLMTRRPNEKIPGSNGHARVAFDLAPAATISNLEVQSSRRGLNDARLERELLARAREDGYDYAYVIESLRDGGLLGAPPRDTGGAFGGGRKVPLPLPGRIWRIDAKGQRTLVRGALLSPVAMRALRRIREVGDTPRTVALRIVPGIVGGWAVDLGADGLLTQTVDVEVRTPALLIDGFELVVERGEPERLPFLVHPLRRGGPNDGDAPTDSVDAP